MPEELIGMGVTSLFAAFILTFNDWGKEAFNLSAGLKILGLVFLFLYVVFFSVTWMIKLLGLRIGVLVYYQPHLVGMMAGLIICVASAGYLPIFLPGGFRLAYPEKLNIGKWRGFHRNWELGFLTGLFPLGVLAWVLILNPIYLANQNPLVVKFIVVVCLTSIYAMIPLPNIALEYGGRVTDFYRYLRGATFGLDIFFASRNWFVALGVYVLFFSFLAYGLTLVSTKVGVLVYLLSWIIGLIGLFLYRQIAFIEGEQYHFGLSWGEGRGP